MMLRNLLALAALLAAPTTACAQAEPQAQPQPQGQPQQPAAPAAAPTVYDYRIVHTYPHDPAAFTQGLLFRDGILYESTGMVGQSTIRHVNLGDGRVIRSVPIPPGQFGEGIVDWGDQIISITWQSGTGYRWDRRTLRQLGEWRYPGEGWGLTRNETDIVMSDGTAQLRFLDPATLSERRRISVTVNGQPLERLNELEWVNGAILANVWMTGVIVRIDPASGNVTGVIDLTSLAAQNGGGDNVLNGIAWDPAGNRLFVTGKNWAHLYEIALTRRP
jgi:glutamine cyclotransferase